MTNLLRLAIAIGLAMPATTGLAQDRYFDSAGVQIHAAPGAPEISDEEFATMVAANRANPNFDALAIAAMFRGTREQAITEAQVSAVRVPTLGIVGSEDPYLKDLQRLKELRPDITLVVVADATRSNQTATTARPEFMAAIRALLSSHPVVR